MLNFEALLEPTKIQRDFLTSREVLINYYNELERSREKGFNKNDYKTTD